MIMKKLTRIAALLLAVLLVFPFAGCGTEQVQAKESVVESSYGDTGEELTVTEKGTYTDKEHVALYIYTYGKLPSNFITKKEAKAAGWVSNKGNLNIVCPGKSIGGDYFGNYEGLLPEKKGRNYHECDIGYNPKGITSKPVYRGEERIIYSNDKLVFYTDDHYATFEQLY